MEEPLTPLAHLGSRVARAQDRALAHVPTGRTKQRILQRPARSAHRRLWWAAASAAALLLVILGVSLSLRAPARELGVALSNGEPAVIGRWIGASAAPLALQFTDGTRVVLAPGSSARVVSIDDAGVRIVVERGFVDVAVAPIPGARWCFEVGPFTVRVTGTRFRAGWDPETSQFLLELEEGSVAVSGPIVGEERPVSTGQNLRVSVESSRMELSRNGSPMATNDAPSDTASIAEPTPTGSALLPAAPASEHGARQPQPSAASEPQAPDTAPTSWTALARAGEYRKSLARANADGLDQILATASAKELSLLADVARLAGDGAQAEQILSTLRRRFKGDSQAALAAFMLGRAAFDQQGAYSSAAGWFTTYLNEQPTGPFAREALGRLMEAHQLAGNTKEARAAARRYLDTYPQGPHANKAKSVLDR